MNLGKYVHDLIFSTYCDTEDLRNDEEVISECKDRLVSIGQKYGIENVFEDNNIRLLSVLINFPGLKILPQRNGNDAVDKDGNEYEIKTTTTRYFSTSHHVNLNLLEKYRNTSWIFALFDSEGVLDKVYKASPDKMRYYFDMWETRLSEDSHINNPKISFSFVKTNCTLVYDASY